MTGLRIVAAFLRRDWGIARSYRLAYVLELATTAVNLILFFTLGRLVDRTDVAAGPELAQGYFSFAVVGLAVLSLANASLTSFSTRLQTELTTGSLEALLTTPAPPSLLIIASATYDFIRASISMLLLITMAEVLFGLHLDTGLAAALTAAVALAANVALYAAVGIVVAGLTVVFKRASAFLTLITGILALLSGVYYPVALLPQPIALLAEHLPFAWGLQVLRAALLTDDLLLGRLALLVITAVASLPVALWLFGLALRQARRAGSLGQY